MPIRKIAKFYQQLSKVDFCRKSIYYVRYKLRFSLLGFFKAVYHFKNPHVTLGKNIIVKGLCYDIKIGDHVVFYDNTIFEFGPNSKLAIGKNSLISYGSLIAVNAEITIGENVQIGEFTSIRDTSHRYDITSIPMKFSKDFSKPIKIGDDVWIGRGCIVLPGTVIEDGVVVAANSVVKGHLLSKKIYGGIPLRYLKDR